MTRPPAVSEWHDVPARPYLSRQRATESRHVGADGPLQYIPETFTAAAFPSAKTAEHSTTKKPTVIIAYLNHILSGRKSFKIHHSCTLHFDLVLIDYFS